MPNFCYFRTLAPSSLVAPKSGALVVATATSPRTMKLSRKLAVKPGRRFFTNQAAFLAGCWCPDTSERFLQRPASTPARTHDFCYWPKADTPVSGSRGSFPGVTQPRSPSAGVAANDPKRTFTRTEAAWSTRSRAIEKAN
jgi:hypothetical protein